MKKKDDLDPDGVKFFNQVFIEYIVRDLENKRITKQNVKIIFGVWAINQYTYSRDYKV